MVCITRNSGQAKISKLGTSCQQRIYVSRVMQIIAGTEKKYSMCPMNCQGKTDCLVYPLERRKVRVCSMCLLEFQDMRACMCPLKCGKKYASLGISGQGRVHSRCPLEFQGKESEWYESLELQSNRECTVCGP